MIKVGFRCAIIIPLPSSGVCVSRVLHLAVLQAVSHVADLVRLLGLQGEVNWRNRLYQTPLHLAVLTANTQAVAALLGLGASLSAQDAHGNTPLHSACQHNDLHLLNTLLEVDLDRASSSASQADAGREGLGVDTEEEEEERRGVLQQRRRREVRAALCTRNYEGFTCLHLAVLHYRQDVVELLLRQGADVNARVSTVGLVHLLLYAESSEGRKAVHLAPFSTIQVILNE